MASEANVQRGIWAGMSGTSTLFRTNSGKGYLSNFGKPIWHADGSVTIPSARPIALGMALLSGDTVPGLSDLNGLTSVVITQEMVGRTVAVYTALEVKESGGGQKKKDQITYLQNVSKAGGIAGFARSLAEAKEIVLAWIENRPVRLL